MLQADKFSAHNPDTAAEPSPEPSSTGSLESFNMIKDWLKMCLRDHEECMQDQVHPWRPSRLLRISASDDSRIFACLDEKLDQNDRATYLTLLLLGKKPVMCLTTSYHADFKKEVPLELLPMKIRDAITTTKATGLEFLWVDSLCIVQDSREDWQHESAQRAMIYFKPFLNPAATWATESSDGLFHQRNSYTSAPISMFLPREKSTRYTQHASTYVIGSSVMYRLVYDDVWYEWIHQATLAL